MLEHIVTYSHIASFVFALMATTLSTASPTKYTIIAALWTSVHITLMLAGGVGGVIAPGSKSAALLQIWAFGLAFICLLGEEMKDGKKFPFLLWLAVHALIAVGNNALIVFDRPRLSTAPSAIVHFLAFGLTFFATGTEGPRTTRIERVTAILWFCAHAAITLAAIAPALARASHLLSVNNILFGHP